MEIKIREQKFLSEIINSESLNSFAFLNFTTNLAANVMDRIKVETTIGLSVGFVEYQGPEDNLDWLVIFGGQDGDILTVTRTDDGSFIEEGFLPEDNIDVGFLLRHIIVPGAISLTKYQDKRVISVTENVIEIDMNGVTGVPIVFSIKGISMFLSGSIEALIYDYGIIENDDNFSTISQVSQSNASYYTGGINIPSQVKKDMLPRGDNRAWISGEASIEYDGRVTDVDFPTSFNYNNLLLFKITHVFIVNPYYLQGQLTNLQNLIPPEDYEGDASYKYVFNAQFRRDLSNPNSSFEIRQDDNLGSVSWFNESFNGFNSIYKINSLKYSAVNGGNETDGLLFSEQTKVEIEIENTEQDFNFLFYEFIPYFSFLPDEDAYQNTTEKNLQENFMYDSIQVGANRISGNKSPFSVNDIIKSAKSTFVSARVQKIEIVLEFTTEQKERIVAKREAGEAFYLLAVQIGSGDEKAGNSSRATLLVDVSEFDDSPDIEGLAQVNNFYMYPYPDTLSLGSGYTDLKAWNEDGIFATFDYVAFTFLEAFINSLNFSLVAYNEATEEFFVLDTYSLDLSNSVVVDGIQEIYVNKQRAYPLDSNDDFLQIKVNYDKELSEFIPDPLDPISPTTYKCVYAQKISWQDWIENLDVPPVFLDENKPNGNRNLKASNYSLKEGYTIRLAVQANIFGTDFNASRSGNTDYLHLSPAIDVYDYGEDENETPEWSAEINTFRALNNENLDGAVLSGEDTIFQVVWTNKNGSITSLDDIFAINRIEETNQQGFQIFELGTRENSDVVQILKPLDGETLLKTELVSGKVVATCLINGDSIDAGKGYNISARIGTKQEINPTPGEDGFDYALDTPMN